VGVGGRLPVQVFKSNFFIIYKPSLRIGHCTPGQSFSLWKNKWLKWWLKDCHALCNSFSSALLRHGQTMVCSQIQHCTIERIFAFLLCLLILSSITFLCCHSEHVPIDNRILRNFFCFGSTGVWTWGPVLAREVLYHFSHIPSPLCFCYFVDRFWAFCPGQPWTVILLSMSPA
jgi:hypothetical protein